MKKMTQKNIEEKLLEFEEKFPLIKGRIIYRFFKKSLQEVSEASFDAGQEAKLPANHHIMGYNQWKNLGKELGYSEHLCQTYQH